MKKASDTLYRLIHTLDKSEQRYFTLFAERHQIGTNNNYLQLLATHVKLDSLITNELQSPYTSGDCNDYGLWTV